MLSGAVDSSVVTNATLINWNNVAEFSPFGVESNVSSYLQWAITISSFGVRLVFAFACYIHPFAGKWNPDHTYTDICKLHAQFFAGII
jgi:hypothetical protein